MQRFTELYLTIDRTTRTNEKLEAMIAYFKTVPPEDAAWALHLLTGRRAKRAISRNVLHETICEVTGYPPWLVNQCYDHVGDFSETLALLLPESQVPCTEPFHRIIERWLLPLPSMTDDERKTVLREAWATLDSTQRFVFHKLISGDYRMGVARTLVVRAIAQVAGQPPGFMEHRLLGAWRPTAEDYKRLLTSEDSGNDPSRPYPFFLAYPLIDPPEGLGNIADWQAEWKWDGLRAQLIRRSGQVRLWSRGEELIDTTFPEVSNLGSLLPDGTVLDGEIVAWENDRALPFTALQKRIGQKRTSLLLFEDVPVIYSVFDLLEYEGKDVRTHPLLDRRGILESLAESLQGRLHLSPIVSVTSWTELAQYREQSRNHGVEGVMLKRRDSSYGVGRTKGDWWKWKIDPYTIDAVLIYAQQGSGRRAGLFTDYTFGVWDDTGDGKRELVPVAKAYSGLTDAEIKEVDSFIRKNTIDKIGPVRIVRPELVFEIAFEAIRLSNRHKSGIAVRFPRMARQRTDKKPADANTLSDLRELIRKIEGKR